MSIAQEYYAERDPAAWLAKRTPTDDDRELILGTMRRWIAGEPVWPFPEVLARWGGEFEMYRRRWAREMRRDESQWEREARWERDAKLYELRQEWIREFGFAIPCAELLDALASLQPVVEIGAGSGYLTALARARGIDIVGTDAGPVDELRYGFRVAKHDPRQLQLAGKTAVRRFRDRSVFCSWPTLNRTWFRQALRAMRIGQRVIVIREEACAEDSAWEYLDACFKQEGEIDLPAWPFMNDRAEVHRKRRHNA
jgi:hypothetical protein